MIYQKGKKRFREKVVKMSHMAVVDHSDPSARRTIIGGLKKIVRKPRLKFKKKKTD